YLKHMFSSNLKEKLIISFEGIDGSGKTTIAKNIEFELNKRNFKVFYTEEPTNSQLGKAIRDLVLLNKNIKLSPFSQALLFTADRNYHVDCVIKNALEYKNIVILDRFIDSTLAYQGENEDLMNMISKINEMAVGFFMPDITFLLDLEPALALKRIEEIDKEEDNFEKLNFLTSVRERYKLIAYNNKERIKIMDASLKKENLVKFIINDILKLIDQKHL
ncbi:MAG: dTMP kinase, partial [Caldisericia bacterium]|nr:dTMP kinase [Caldisericia bacterium]